MDKQSGRKHCIYKTLIALVDFCESRYGWQPRECRVTIASEVFGANVGFIGTALHFRECGGGLCSGTGGYEELE